MLSGVDYKFNYFFLIRFLLVNKINSFFNVFDIPMVNAIKLFFSVKNRVFLDVSENFNFFYFFKFFFGRKAFLSSFQSKLSYGETYFSYRVELFLSKSDVYFFLFYLVNDILFLAPLNTVFFSKFIKSESNFLFIVMRELSLFTSIKTNLGLFDLKTPLFIKCFFAGDNFLLNKFLLMNFKLAHF